MTSRLLKILVLLAVTILVASCKVALIVPSGGDVTSASGTRNCAGGSLCEQNITDSTFHESFTAVARPGYVFSKWNSGSDFLCPNSTNPTCVITTVGTAGNAGIEAVIATGKFFYAMPVFTFVGVDTDGDGIKDHLDTDDDNDGVLDVNDDCPLKGPNLSGFGCPGALITDTITVNGKTWAQPDLFIPLSWDAINTVCPAGVCADGEVLNGLDMGGWRWANGAEVMSLFQSYGTSLCDLPTLMEADGWRMTHSDPGSDLNYLLEGYVSYVEGFAHPYAQLLVGVQGLCFIIAGNVFPIFGNYPIGAWFYR